MPKKLRYRLTDKNENDRAVTVLYYRVLTDTLLQPAGVETVAVLIDVKQEAQLPQRNSSSAAHTCAADALFLCGSCIGIGTCRS